MTLDDYRREFELAANRSISMPLAGAIVWAIVALVSTQVTERLGVLILLFSTGAIFPIALLIGRLRGERVASTGPLGQLIVQCVIMVNLLWAIHIPLFMQAPTFVPLSLGIGLGLHWIVYSWIVQHPVGTVHAMLRTALVSLAWIFFPEQRVFAVGMAVVAAYALSLWQMATRPIPQPAPQLQNRSAGAFRNPLISRPN